MTTEIITLFGIAHSKYSDLESFYCYRKALRGAALRGAAFRIEKQQNKIQNTLETKPSLIVYKY